jgi:hypothetical protein
MMSSGAPLVVVVVLAGGAGVVGGKVASLGGRVRMNDVGVML